MCVCECVCKKKREREIFNDSRIYSRTEPLGKKQTLEVPTTWGGKRTYHGTYPPSMLRNTLFEWPPHNHNKDVSFVLWLVSAAWAAWLLTLSDVDGGSQQDGSSGGMLGMEVFPPESRAISGIPWGKIFPLCAGCVEHEYKITLSVPSTVGYYTIPRASEQKDICLEGNIMKVHLTGLNGL